MNEKKPYVSLDQDGAMRVGNAGVGLEGIIAGFRSGQSPEAIRSQYRSLTLEEVYGAITWCLAHPNEVDAYLQEQDRLWKEARAHQDKNVPPVVSRLRSTEKVASGAK